MIKKVNRKKQQQFFLVQKENVANSGLFLENVIFSNHGESSVY